MPGKLLCLEDMRVAMHNFKVIAAESKQQIWLAFAKEVSLEMPLLKFWHVYRKMTKSPCTKPSKNITCDDGSILTLLILKKG
jgi:hypothetical protein